MNPEAVAESSIPIGRLQSAARHSAQLVLERYDDPNTMLDEMEQQTLDASPGHIPDSIPVLSPETPSLTFKERDILIGQVINRYRTNREVKRALSQYQLASSQTRYDLDPLSQYMSETSKYPLLSPEDEITLFGMLEQGLKVYRETDGVNFSSDQEKALIDMTIAYHKIFYSNLKLVIRAAKVRFRGNKATIDPIEYVQEGNLALDMSIKRFDVSKGYKFSTYAMWWLKQRMQRTHAQQSRTIRIPIESHLAWLETINVEDELTETLKRPPTIEEIANASGRKVAEVADIIHSGAQSLVSLDEPLNECGGEEVSDIIPSTVMETFEEELMNKDLLASIISSAGLTRNQLLCLSLRFQVPVQSLAGIKLSTTTGYRDYYSVLKSSSSNKLLPYETIHNLSGLSERTVKLNLSEAMRKIRHTIDG